MGAWRDSYLPWRMWGYLFRREYLSCKVQDQQTVDYTAHYTPTRAPPYTESHCNTNRLGGRGPSSAAPAAEAEAEAAAAERWVENEATGAKWCTGTHMIVQSTGVEAEHGCRVFVCQRLYCVCVCVCVAWSGGIVRGRGRRHSARFFLRFWGMLVGRALRCGIMRIIIITVATIMTIKIDSVAHDKSSRLTMTLLSFIYFFFTLTYITKCQSI